ncbi:methyltransferase domain-containing protein, partial [Colletotrichum incanum]
LGGLHLSPSIESIDGKPARVLDIGTGSGAWAIACAEKYGNKVKVTGVDLRPIQPTMVPANCSFEIFDCELEWNWRQPVDFVHIGLTAGCIRDRKRLFERAFASLRPGGFLEVLDFHDTPQCEDDTCPKDDPARLLCLANRKAAAKLQRPVDDITQYGAIMEDVGFADVKENKRCAPTNPWPHDATQQRLGQMMAGAVADHTEALYLCRLVRAEYDCAEAAVLCAETRKTLQDPEKHLKFVLQTFWGQKPFFGVKEQT